jgi:hypothetical protein
MGSYPAKEDYCTQSLTLFYSWLTSQPVTLGSTIVDSNIPELRN